MSKASYKEIENCMNVNHAIAVALEAKRKHAVQTLLEICGFCSAVKQGGSAERAIKRIAELVERGMAEADSQTPMPTRLGIPGTPTIARAALRAEADDAAGEEVKP